VYEFTKSPKVLASLFLCLLSLNVQSRISIAESAEKVTPLLNGQFVPDVILQTAFGKDINLKTLIESKPSR